MLYATTILLAAEEGEEDSGIDLLLPDAGELVVGIVAFTIVFLFVWRFAWPSINRMLEERQAAVSGELEGAQEAKEEAESLLKDYQQQLAEAREEGNRIVEEARQSAEAMRNDIVAKAQDEADEIRRKAQEDAATELDRARTELREEVATLSLDVAERVVAGGLDRSGQQALIDRYIDDLGGLEGR
jgi:F-type H+-transporting ATPase subunit b